MKSFKEFCAEADQKEKAALERIALFEHETYKGIPGTKSSYRVDAGNTNTKTLKHAHVYAKRKGRGHQLYAVNIDGSGHDGSSGTTIPGPHADYLRGLGYSVPATNILEGLGLDSIDQDAYTLTVLLLEDA